ncbi:MAG: hypothetical protein IJX17_04155 [Clostridia bacterium]|nr:hypothetical protein [Clostridia bacterium]
MNKYNFKQVAKWFVDKYNEDTNKEKSVLTKTKLHNLMYYAKGLFYVFQNDSFFDGIFLVSNNGVKCKELASLFSEKNDSLENIFADEKPITNVLVVVTLDFVYQKIGSITEEKLAEIMKEEKLISGKEVSEKINEEKLAEDFRETYLQDEQTNKFNIMRDEIVDIISFMTYKKYDKAFRVLGQ